MCGDVAVLPAVYYPAIQQRAVICPQVLEEGMVIAMEPHVNHWHIQDMFVVRAQGPELISDKFKTDQIFDCG